MPLENPLSRKIFITKKTLQISSLFSYEKLHHYHKCRIC
ncbi:hypothetical protein Chls_602 [Chlamydia suis]|uniref:Uncharacterized protein n=1 Tax=Chlamydia suis TaxID=83559 RepID=A0ABX6IU88_9CHLA|nr:hypothetical protein Chls_602 [Chlamydia suis]